MESTLRGLIVNIRLDPRLPRRLTFPYHFKTKRMLLTAKSFSFFLRKIPGDCPKKFHHFKWKIEPSRTVESTLRELIVTVTLGF